MAGGSSGWQVADAGRVMGRGATVSRPPESFKGTINRAPTLGRPTSAWADAMSSRPYLETKAGLILPRKGPQVG